MAAVSLADLTTRELVVDLHIHSHYSRATSRNCTLEGLYAAAKIKGISVLGTGDIVHPLWLAECRGKLEVCEGGLLRLKPELAANIDALLPPSVQNAEVYFVPTAEIATVYKKSGKTRKLHQLVVLSGLEAAERLQAELSKIGNIRADGRAILSLDSKLLLALLLRVDSAGLYIPAHIWTPWFGLFGSKSGFDSLQEAYEELTPHIRAIETGLSSDPAMNARIPQLDGVAITSHSDAHSPQKLGREATVLHAQNTYADIIGALKTNDERLVGTIEFFPEEGKYFADGHRTCDVCFTPEETKAHGGICPVCKKPLVVGVNYRVSELADREFVQANQAKTTEYIIPLPEVIAELFQVKFTTSKRVLAEYERVITALGNEFAILRTLPLATIAKASPELAVAIENIRTGKVVRKPGYDGVYGTISALDKTTEPRKGPTT